MRFFVAMLLMGLASTQAHAFGKKLSPGDVLGLRNKNLHLIDKNDQTGYAMYRTSEPKLEDYKELCQLGVTKMIVLSGTGDVERGFQQHCPQMEIIYDTKQSSSIPLSDEFLTQFDEWVRLAKEKGTKIAFRCSCGCHRTGRLAAYYNMKFKGWSADQAIDDMKDKGKVMWYFPQLPPQVRALNDYIYDRPCSQKAKYCVQENEPTPSAVAQAEVAQGFKD